MFVGGVVGCILDNILPGRIKSYSIITYATNTLQIKFKFRQNMGWVCRSINIKKTQRRQYDYEGHNTPLGRHNDQGP